MSNSPIDEEGKGAVVVLQAGSNCDGSSDVSPTKRLSMSKFQVTKVRIDQLEKLGVASAGFVYQMGELTGEQAGGYRGG